jgi:hypothetical protein
MSAKIESPESLERAVRRVLGLPAFVVGATLANDPKLHNVGGCGSCGGGGSCGAGQCVCEQRPFIWPSNLAVPPGYQLGTGGVLILPGGQPATTTAPPGTAAPTIATPPPLGMQLPTGPAFSAQMWADYVARFSSLRCVPYEDAIRDGLLMSMAQSDETAIAAGATANVDIQVENGWMDGYYFDISAVTDVGGAVVPEGVSMTPPRNVGCPVPACTRDVPTNSRFFRSDDGCCLGKPYRSILTETANGTPFRTAVTNNTAAPIVVQTIVRGFCTNTRVCV